MSDWTDRIRAGFAAASLGVCLLGAGHGAAAQTARPAPPASAAPAPAKPAYNPNIGASTGLPIPRFVSLRADAVNLRVGPGDQYPIAWVYHRVGLPVEVLREFDVWRLVVDADGTKGWMHEATLVGTRHFIIDGQSAVTLFRGASTDADPAAQLMPGVIGLIERCDAGSDWCRVRVEHLGGWLERSEFWGTLPGEQIPAK
jgi:SH3-like domain-containing protein